MRVAALDMGSNTTLLLIADVDKNGQVLKVLHDEAQVTRMGQGVHQNRVLAPDALMRLESCLKDYSQTIQKYHVDSVRAVATSAARDVKNRDSLFELGKKYGIAIEVVSGDVEAKLTYSGALSDRQDTSGILVIDVGGGSTEIIASHNDVISGYSVDVGSVRLTELLLPEHPVSRKNLEELDRYVKNEFAKAPLPRGPFKEVVAVAGTPTTLAALEQRCEFSTERIHGFKLTGAMLEGWLSRLAKLSIADREALPGMEPKRADVLVAGTAILKLALEYSKLNEMTVSTRGVRFGIAAQSKWPN